MPGGRPSKYTEEIVKELCHRISVGESLKKICEDPKMPSLHAVLLWANTKPEFLSKYASARDAAFEIMADEVVELADTPAIEFASPGDPSGVKHRQLKIDARKWILSKRASKKYGDRVDVHNTGQIDVRIEQVRRIIVDPLIIEQKLPEVKEITDESA